MAMSRPEIAGSPCIDSGVLFATPKDLVTSPVGVARGRLRLGTMLARHGVMPVTGLAGRGAIGRLG